MRRATKVIQAARWDGAGAIDSVTLDADERHRRRIVLTGERGTVFLLDLPQATALRNGDGLVLDDGVDRARYGQAGAAARDRPRQTRKTLPRLAWHLGNRHVDMQFVGDRLRIRRDHVLEDMLRGLGARLTPIEAPFDPEPGAYSSHHGLDNGP